MNRYLAMTFCLLFGFASSANAASTNPFGRVVALNNVSQLGSIAGTAGFDLPSAGTYTSNTYAAGGMVLQGTHSGFGQPFNEFFPSIQSAGRAWLPTPNNFGGQFPQPILGGGTNTGPSASLGLVATFTKTINQFGLTMSRNQIQYISAWAADGSLIGMVQWVPDFRPDGEGSSAGFVGIDTGRVPIKMIAVGNDNVFAGQEYEISGSTTFFDSAIWANRRVPEPSGFFLIGCAGISLVARRRR